MYIIAYLIIAKVLLKVVFSIRVRVHVELLVTRGGRTSVIRHMAMECGYNVYSRLLTINLSLDFSIAIYIWCLW